MSDHTDRDGWLTDHPCIVTNCGYFYRTVADVDAYTCPEHGTITGIEFAEHHARERQRLDAHDVTCISERFQ